MINALDSSHISDYNPRDWKTCTAKDFDLGEGGSMEEFLSVTSDEIISEFDGDETLSTIGEQIISTTDIGASKGNIQPEAPLPIDNIDEEDTKTIFEIFGHETPPTEEGERTYREYNQYTISVFMDIRELYKKGETNAVVSKLKTISPENKVMIESLMDDYGEYWERSMDVYADEWKDFVALVSHIPFAGEVDDARNLIIIVDDSGDDVEGGPHGPAPKENHVDAGDLDTTDPGDDDILSIQERITYSKPSEEDVLKRLHNIAWYNIYDGSIIPSPEDIDDFIAVLKEYEAFEAVIYIEKKYRSVQDEYNLGQET